MSGCKYQRYRQSGKQLKRYLNFPITPKKKEKIWSFWHFFNEPHRGICLQMCPTPTEREGKKAPCLSVASCRRPPNSNQIPHLLVFLPWSAPDSEVCPLLENRVPWLTQNHKRQASHHIFIREMAVTELCWVWLIRRGFLPRCCSRKPSQSDFGIFKSHQ